MLAFLSHFTGSADNTILLALSIMLCAFFFEDLTIVIVGLLAADGVVSIPLAFCALYAGMVLADGTLYALGSIARTHPRLAHYIDHDFTAPFRSWMERRYALAVFSGHFVPGWRFTTYVASGFFRFPLSTYIPMALISGLLLETVLFSASYWFGSLTSQWLGPVRWGVAAAVLLVLFFIGRHNLQIYQVQKDRLDTDDDTRAP